MPPSTFPRGSTDIYVGDSKAWTLTDLEVDGVPVDLSDAARYRVQGSIRADRLPDTPVAAVLTVTFPDEGGALVRLSPEQSELLRPLLAAAEPQEKTTALSVVAAIDVQVEVLEGGEVLDRVTLLSDDATLGGDVTR